MRRACRPWNHYNHCHSLILNEIPAGCQQVLDVGCGADAGPGAERPGAAGSPASMQAAQQACSKFVPGRPGGPGGGP